MQVRERGCKGNALCFSDLEFLREDGVTVVVARFDGCGSTTILQRVASGGKSNVSNRAGGLGHAETREMGNGFSLNFRSWGAVKKI